MVRNSVVDIQRKIIWEIPEAISLTPTSSVYVEFIQDCLLDIGEYKTFDTSAYPTVIKLAGERIYAYRDTSRVGYVYDHVFDGYRLNMFISAGAVRIVA
jgi:hypothetical protein